METSLGKSAISWNSELNEFVSDDHVRLAAVLHDYKPTLSLVYIPKKDRTTPTDHLKPWAILDSPAYLPPHIIRYLSDEEMKNPTAVLKWIFAGDLEKNRPKDVLARIEAEQAAEQLMELKWQEDDLEDRLEHVEFLASGGRDKKHTIRLDKGRKLERT